MKRSLHILGKQQHRTTYLVLNVEMYRVKEDIKVKVACSTFFDTLCNLQPLQQVELNCASVVRIFDITRPLPLCDVLRGM